MREWEAVIIGGGPAGLGAAIEIASAGGRVLLVDENDTAGGQLFKQIHKFFGSRAHSAGTRGFVIGQQLLSEIKRLGVEVWLSSAAVGFFSEKTLMVRREIGEEKFVVNVNAKTILFATGASENTICFPGWTLPGVMGAGAAQTMINVHRVLPGKRILMVGSGNVGLIVSYQLMQAGADVLGIVEAANTISGYGVHAGKIRRAGVDFILGHSVLKAHGENNRLKTVILAKLDKDWNFIPGSEKEYEVDVLCLAVGLRPLAELVCMSGAQHIFVPEMSGWMPLHDENMMTSIPGVYVAGDVSGVEEANTALDEGRLAGVAIAEQLGLIDSGKAAIMKNDLLMRLRSLRMGPFGFKRADAKNRVIEYCKSIRDDHESIYIKGRK